MMRRGTPGRAHSLDSPHKRATIGGVSRPAATRPEGPSGRTAALVLVLAVLVTMLALPVRSWFLQQAQIADAQASLAATEQRIAALEAERQRWQDDTYVGEQARLRLNYVLPGEVGIVVLQPDEAPPVAERPETWYEGLWQTVDSASGRGETTLGEPVQVRESAPR